MTNVNGSVHIGRALSGGSNPRGTLNMDRGGLSIAGSMSVGSAGIGFSTFSESVFRQSTGTTTLGSVLSVASSQNAIGAAELVGGTLTVSGSAAVASAPNSEGILTIGGGVLDVTGDVAVGRSSDDSTGRLTQSGGDFSLDAITVHPGSQYDLTGGTLSIADRFDLTGTLNFGGGNATINLAGNGVVEWSQGNLPGSAAGTTFTAGIDSQSFFPVGFDPNVEFARSSSQRLLHVQDTPLVVPVGFTMAHANRQLRHRPI